MQDDLDAGDLDDFVEGIELGDVGDDLDVELVLVLWVVLPNLGRLLLRTYGGHDVVSLLEELFEDVGCAVVSKCPCLAVRRP